ncbi:unnamed protein product [Amoebophrya sp. A25]|nr:unnamed protein product [Amoebophrya sp. A25]|eukprot:GSA25T00018877001.1
MRKGAATVEPESKVSKLHAKLSKDIRKFRTESNGMSVKIGHHREECRGVWDWRVGNVVQVDEYRDFIFPDPPKKSSMDPELIRNMLQYFRGPPVLLKYKDVEGSKTRVKEADGTLRLQ